MAEDRVVKSVLCSILYLDACPWDNNELALLEAIYYNERRFHFNTARLTYMKGGRIDVALLGGVLLGTRHWLVLMSELLMGSAM